MIKYMQTSIFISYYTYTTKANTLNLNYIKMRRIIMEKIKISVIVPVFNAEKYLKMCLNSLVSQTLKNIEIICIDDGSTDNSLATLDKFKSKDDRIKIIKQKNYGVSMARNNGISEAQGEYIGFVDADDWVDKDFFEKLYNAAQKYNADIATAGYYRRGKILRSKKLNYKKEEKITNPTEKIKAVYIPKWNYIWNKIYKRESLLKIDIPFENGRYYEDMIWLVKVIYSLNSLVTVPNIFYHYRKNEGSIVTQKSKKHSDDRNYAEKEMLKFMKEHDIPMLLPCKNAEKLKISCFGINLLKVEYYTPYTAKYKLFGFLTVLTVRKVF